jgi:hypothetical protein
VRRATRAQAGALHEDERQDLFFSPRSRGS